jgi:hypothetical protein
VLCSAGVDLSDAGEAVMDGATANAEESVVDVHDRSCSLDCDDKMLPPIRRVSDFLLPEKCPKPPASAISHNDITIEMNAVQGDDKEQNESDECKVRNSLQHTDYYNA